MTVYRHTQWYAPTHRELFLSKNEITILMKYLKAISK